MIPQRLIDQSVEVSQLLGSPVLLQLGKPTPAQLSTKMADESAINVRLYAIGVKRHYGFQVLGFGTISEWSSGFLAKTQTRPAARISENNRNIVVKYAIEQRDKQQLNDVFIKHERDPLDFIEFTDMVLALLKVKSLAAQDKSDEEKSEATTNSRC